MDLRLVNHKVLESFIKAGACDSLGRPRAVLLASLDEAMDQASSLQKDRARGQLTLFEDVEASSAPAHAEASISRLRDWPESQKLAFEKALLGFYVSGHPLARYERLIASLATSTSQGLLQQEEGAIVTVGGMFTTIKQTVTKKSGEEMAVCMLEDLEGETEVLVFPNAYAQLKPQLKPNAVIFVEGRVAMREDRPRLVAQQIVPVEQGPGKLATAVELILRRPGVEQEFLQELKTLLYRFPGSIPIFLTLELPQEPPTRLKLSEALRIEPRTELLEALSGLLGEDGVRLRRQHAGLKPRPAAAPAAVSEALAAQAAVAGV